MCVENLVCIFWVVLCFLEMCVCVCVCSVLMAVA